MRLFRNKATAEARANLLGFPSLDMGFTHGLCPASRPLTQVNGLPSKAAPSCFGLTFCVV